MSAMVEGRDIIDVVNLPNQGQIPNLPSRAVVETLGLVNSTGFSPVQAGPLPGQILPLVWPHAHNQLLVVEAGLEGDMEKDFVGVAERSTLCSPDRAGNPGVGFASAAGQ